MNGVPPMPLRNTRDTAFTLIELLVVVAISGVLVLALATFTNTSLQQTAVLQKQNLSEQTVRVALARLAREASLAKSFSITESQRLAFTCTDITGDGSDDVVEYRYYPSTGELKRTLNGVTEVFATGVTDFALEYQYESETEVTIAAPGDTLPMVLRQFDGTYDEGNAEDAEIDVVYETWYVEQTFENYLEAARATSVTVRARAKTVPPPIDMYVTLDDLSRTLATGWLKKEWLSSEFQDITVPLTWSDSTETMVLGKTYRLRFRPGGSYPYRDNSGTLQYLHVLDGPGLGGGLSLSYWDEDAQHQTFGDTASLYFTVRGEVSVTTPTRSEQPVSILKKITATLQVSEGGQTARHARTWKVINQ